MCREGGERYGPALVDGTVGALAQGDLLPDFDFVPLEVEREELLRERIRAGGMGRGRQAVCWLGGGCGEQRKKTRRKVSEGDLVERKGERKIRTWGGGYAPALEEWGGGLPRAQLRRGFPDAIGRLN
jgi:hypothetical protein